MATSTANMSLAVWDQLADNFSHADLEDNWGKVDIHDHSTGKGVQIDSGGIASGAIESTHIGSGAVTTDKIENGAVTGDKLDISTIPATSLSGQINTNQIADGAITPGKFSRVSRKVRIADAEARTNVAYGKLATPDEVTGLTLATGEILFVAYQALWKESNLDTARAAIFLDGAGAEAQLKVAVMNGGPLEQEAGVGGSGAGVGFYVPLVTSQGGHSVTDLSPGLTSGGELGNPSSDSSFVTTGQTLGWYGAGGGAVAIFAAADTYTVSIQFKASSGTVTVKERNLWAWVQGF